MQIEIYSNLEAYVCLSYDTMTTKTIFQMKRNPIFRQNFQKPLSKWVVLFQLRCLPSWKRRKVSLNLGDLRWFCLLSSANERIAVGVSWNAAFYLLLHESAPFSRNFVNFARVDQLQSEQIFRCIHE